jgi:hypothetical protein
MYKVKSKGNLWFKTLLSENAIHLINKHLYLIDILIFTKDV